MLRGIKKLVTCSLILLCSSTLLLSQGVTKVDTICYSIEDLKILAQNNIERKYCEQNIIVLDSIIKIQGESLLMEKYQNSMYEKTLDACNYRSSELYNTNQILLEDKKRFIKIIKVQAVTSLILLAVCLL